MKKLKTAFAFAVLIGATSSAIAAETVTYTYDAKGRLVRVVRSGASNKDVTTDLTHDKANNRTRVRVSGASH